MSHGYIKFDPTKVPAPGDPPATPATPATQHPQDDGNYKQDEGLPRTGDTSQPACDSMRLVATPATQDGTHRLESRQSRNESQRVAGASAREGMPVTHGNTDTSARLSGQSRESRKSRKGETVIGDLGVQPEGDTPPAPLGKVGRHGTPCPKCGDTWQWPTSRGGWVCSTCICAAPGPVQIATPNGDIIEEGSDGQPDWITERNQTIL